MYVVKRRKRVKPVDVAPEKEVIRQIRSKVTRMQIPEPKRPRDRRGGLLCPVLPPDLTMLNDAALGRLYGEFCAMAIYVQLRLAFVGVERSVAAQVEKYARAKTRLRASGTVGDKEAQVEVDPSVRQYTLDRLTGEGVEQLTESMMNGYIMGKDALSRELTRRGLVAKDPSLSR